MVDEKKNTDDQKGDQTFSFSGEFSFSHPAIIAVIRSRRKSSVASCLKDFSPFGIIISL